LTLFAGGCFTSAAGDFLQQRQQMMYLKILTRSLNSLMVMTSAMKAAGNKIQQNTLCPTFFGG